MSGDKKFSQEQVKKFEDGEVIFLEGDDTREMYIVRSGSVAVSKRTQHGEISLATLTKGDFVGEMSLLETLPRSATARARGPTEVLAIHPGGFLLKIRRDPTFAFEIMQTLSRRLRTTNERLMRAVESGHVNSEKFSQILTSAEFGNKKDDAA
jgi:CRP/FNR family cyclic AMP-dependent transcriptional regulator